MSKRVPIAIIASDVDLKKLDGALEDLSTEAEAQDKDIQERKRVIWREIERTLESKGLIKDAKNTSLAIKNGVIFEEESDNSSHSLVEALKGMGVGVSIERR